MTSGRCFPAVLLTAFATVVHAQTPATRQPVPGAPAGVMAFVDVNVIPMDTERVLSGQTVLVEDGWITALGLNGRVTLPKEAVQIAGRGQYLIPGLSDCHAHLQPMTDSLGESKLFRYLAEGVTTIRYSSTGVSVSDELVAMVEAGLTPYQALLTSTRHMAQYLGTLDETGTVAAGKRADLVLLGGNPLEDIRNTARPMGVMLGGRWLPRTEIDRRLAIVRAVRAAPSATPPLPQPVAPALVLQGVILVDVTDGRLIPDQTVVVIGTRIHAVGPAAKIRTPAGARVVNAQGKYLIPGLWDMHIHPKHYPDVFYPLLIANGVTGIRDAGTPVPLDTVLQWRREIAAGKRVGPRQIVTGRYLEDDEGDPFAITVTTPADARRVVDSLRGAGADFIKVHGASPEVYFAIAAEARRVGVPFGGHVPNDIRPIVPLLDASDSGVSIIDHSHNLQREGHCMGATASIERCSPVAERFRRNGTWVVPTLMVHTVSARRRTLSHALRANALRYWPDSMVPRKASDDSSIAAPSSGAPARSDSVHPSDRLDIMQQAGVPILAGTDASPIPSTPWFPGAEFVPGFSLHEELATIVWAGLTPLTALQAATLNPAKALHATDSLGTVAPGKLADLVLLNANPLADISNTTKIQAVIANGRYFDRAALDALLAKIARAARGP